MNKHSFYVQEAVLEAKKCVMGSKHGCIIVQRTKKISSGHNSNDMHNYRNFSLHAEVAATNNMNKSGVNADNIIMYVVRINNRDLHKGVVVCGGVWWCVVVCGGCAFIIE